MKSVQHYSKKDVFENWLHRNFQTKYIWPQICYDVNTSQPIHIVFEKNQRNQRYIQWPINHLGTVPSTNIDFTKTPPTLPEGRPWDYRNWHQHALNGRLLNPPSRVPKSFWDWRLQTRPQNNLTCDLDFLCQNDEGRYVGIEATEIYYVDESPNIEQDCYEHFKRLFIYRRGNTGGFNVQQLRAQYAYVKDLFGDLYMIFHQIQKPAYRLVERRVLLIKVDEETLRLIERMLTAKRLPTELRRKIQFYSLNDAFRRLGFEKQLIR